MDKLQQAQAARSTLNTAQKIALFRWLFRGREDVYAQRWESPDGRSGYSPKTERDWKAYYAAKKEDRKRVDKETRKYIPLTGEAIHAHLAGKQTLGVYPLLLDETCWFLAVDFDKKTWKDDAAAFRATCRELNVPAAVERSRSGNGGFSPQERLQFHQQHSAPGDGQSAAVDGGAVRRASG
jgi:hypothetical protein